MQYKKIISITAAALLVSACAQPMGQAGQGVTQGGNSINKQDIGTLAGAIGGGIIGSNIGGGKGKIAGTIGGTLLGAMVGSSIGASLDKADEAYHEKTAQTALENAQPGQTMPWQNAQSGHSGSVTPSNYYTNNSGQYCREYTQTITVGGKTQKGYGTACRQEDGTWQIVQ